MGKHKKRPPEIKTEMDMVMSTELTGAVPAFLPGEDEAEALGRALHITGRNRVDE